MTIGRHGNSVRRLGHAGDDGQSRSLAGGAGRHRDVVGRLADEGGHLLNLAKDEHLAPKALVTPTGETYAMVAPTITKDIFILGDNTGQARRMDVGDSELSDLYPTQFLGQVRIGLQECAMLRHPFLGSTDSFTSIKTDITSRLIGVCVEG